MKQTKTIVLQKPHSPGQQEILDWNGHGVLFAGRRWGKTQVLVTKLVKSCLDAPGLYWWVGLSWRSASMKRAWRLIKHYCRRIWVAVGEKPDKHIRESDKECTFPGGGVIWLRTAERADSLAGEGVRGVVLDEFSLMAPNVWTEFIAATLLDYGGWAMFAGVPKGLNWASRLWMTAKTRSGWKAWQFSSYDNPTLSKEAIDELAAGLPERLRRQEIGAEVIDDAGAVFRRVTEMAVATKQDKAIDGHVYVAGVDWGRTNDATVFTVVDVSLKHLVYLDRMIDTDYEQQLDRLIALHHRFHFTVIMVEVNSMGQPLFERLKRKGLPVVAFITTNATKQVVIDGLTMAFEQDEIKILPDETLINELMAYEMESMDSGKVRFNAPAGMHDDCVMSLALAWHAVRRNARRRQPISYDGWTGEIYNDGSAKLDRDDPLYGAEVYRFPFVSR